ncbi:hypothetical protein ACFQ3S_13380 [Mucilaginibacter terrae]
MIIGDGMVFTAQVTELLLKIKIIVLSMLSSMSGMLCRHLKPKLRLYI